MPESSLVLNPTTLERGVLYFLVDMFLFDRGSICFRLPCYVFITEKKRHLQNVDYNKMAFIYVICSINEYTFLNVIK